LGAATPDSSTDPDVPIQVGLAIANQVLGNACVLNHRGWRRQRRTRRAPIGLGTALAGVFTAHSSWAVHGVAFTGGCLGILGLGCALFAIAGAWGRRDEEYLRHWLSQAAREPPRTERNSG